MSVDLGPVVPHRRPRTPLSVDFVNTRYAVRGRLQDSIETPTQLLTWLRRQAATPGTPDFGTDLPTDLDPAEVETFHALRATTSNLLRAATEHRLGTSTELATLNQTALIAPNTPALETRDNEYLIIERSRETGLPFALATIARDAIYLLGSKPNANLRACHGPGCLLLFITNDPRRQWCSTTCGNRARATRHYHRHRNN